MNEITEMLNAIEAGIAPVSFYPIADGAVPSLDMMKDMFPKTRTEGDIIYATTNDGDATISLINLNKWTPILDDEGIEINKWCAIEGDIDSLFDRDAVLIGIERYLKREREVSEYAVSDDDLAKLEIADDIVVTDEQHEALIERDCRNRIAELEERVEKNEARFAQLVDAVQDLTELVISNKSTITALLEVSKVMANIIG